MRQIKTLTVLLTVLFGIAACSAVKVQSGYDGQAHFTAYKTFAWLPAYRWRQSWFQQRLSPIDAYIRRFVADTLTSKGFREASGGKPDLWIAYYAGVEGPVDVSTFDYHGWQDSSSERKESIASYKKGTLVLDFIDAKTDSLVWRGSASSALRSSAEDPTRVGRALRELLTDFPPQPATVSPTR